MDALFMAGLFVLFMALNMCFNLLMAKLESVLDGLR